MTNSTTETLVGAAVLAITVGFIIYASQSVGLGATGDAKTVTASFRSVDGVIVGTDVRMAGVKIGSVTGIDLNPVTFRAETQFTIDDQLNIPDDSSAVISSEGLLGGTFVEIIPGASDFNIEDGGEFIDTQGAVSLISLLLKFVGGGGQ
ncbi:MAG: outer membrane lipid asymmetry maintenance protein MlaD [Pseudomonadota bacterium]